MQLSKVSIYYVQGGNDGYEEVLIPQLSAGSI